MQMAPRVQIPVSPPMDINTWLAAEHQPGETNLERLMYLIKEIAPRCGSEGPFGIYFASSDWEVEFTIKKPKYLDHVWQHGEVIIPE